MYPTAALAAETPFADKTNQSLRRQRKADPEAGSIPYGERKRVFITV